MKKQVPTYHIVQSLLANLKDRRKLTRAIFEMKNADQYASVTSGITSLLKQMPHMEHVLFGSDVPKPLVIWDAVNSFLCVRRGLNLRQNGYCFRLKEKSI